jgi:hypothetical protein
MPDFGAYMAILPQQDKGVVLLFNACHWWFNPVLTELGAGATALLAGAKYKPTPFSTWIPWMLRAQLLIPALQVLDVAATLRMLRFRYRRPEHRPSGSQISWKRLLVPLIPELMIALSLRSVLGKRRTYLKLFMPDYSWIAMVCGSFAGIWALLRTGLILRTARNKNGRAVQCKK